LVRFRDWELISELFGNEDGRTKAKDCGEKGPIAIIEMGYVCVLLSLEFSKDDLILTVIDINQIKDGYDKLRQILGNRCY